MSAVPRLRNPDGQGTVRHRRKRNPGGRMARAVRNEREVRSDWPHLNRRINFRVGKGVGKMALSDHAGEHKNWYYFWGGQFKNVCTISIFASFFIPIISLPLPSLSFPFQNWGISPGLSMQGDRREFGELHRALDKLIGKPHRVISWGTGGWRWGWRDTGAGRPRSQGQEGVRREVHTEEAG